MGWRGERAHQEGEKQGVVSGSSEDPRNGDRARGEATQSAAELAMRLGNLVWSRGGRVKI